MNVCLQHWGCCDEAVLRGVAVTWSGRPGEEAGRTAITALEAITDCDHVLVEKVTVFF